MQGAETSWTRTGRVRPKKAFLAGVDMLQIMGLKEERVRRAIAQSSVEYIAGHYSANAVQLKCKCSANAV